MKTEDALKSQFMELRNYARICLILKQISSPSGSREKPKS